MVPNPAPSHLRSDKPTKKEGRGGVGELARMQELEEKEMEKEPLVEMASPFSSSDEFP
jgi:hypothetical protein